MMRYVPSRSKIWYKKFSLTNNKYNLTNNEFNNNNIYNKIFQQSNQRRTISSNRSGDRIDWIDW